MTAPDISVCVAVYRRHRPPNLRTLAASLGAAAGPRTWELVVALNGIAAEAAEVPPDATVVAFDENRGVPIAWNAAIASARGRMLCVVNDDVGLGAGSLAMLADALERHEAAGVVGPVGTAWDLSAGRHERYVDVSGAAPGDVTPCDVLSGFLMLTWADVFAQVGGFDEALTPCGFEEVDYCTAVRRVARREALIVGGVSFEHEFGISARRGWRRISYMGRSERLDVVAARNRAHFVRKWAAR